MSANEPTNESDVPETATTGVSELSDGLEGGVTIVGTMCEVGNLEGLPGRGVRICTEGETVEVIGLTEDECRKVGSALYKDITVTITIQPSNAAHKPQAKEE